jgi:hypothetical protein
MPAQTFSLSIHADYRCRHSGACCTAGWEIPVEALRQPLIGAALLPTRGGCRFFDTDGRRSCAIHRDHGHDAMPMACQQFPRLALLDDRGVHVSLSHFCPTAAAMLFRDDVPLDIVTGPPAFPTDAYYEGLDARGALPPLLAPDRLMDLDSFSAWEREAVRLLARDDWSVERALAAIRSATNDLSRWRPGDGALLDAVGHAFRRFHERPGATRREIRTSRPLRYYVAAKCFASWTAYQSDRLSAVVAAAKHALAVVRQETRRLTKSAAPSADESVLLEAIQTAEHRLLHRVMDDRLNG